MLRFRLIFSLIEEAKPEATMKHYEKGQTYGQKVRVLIDLLKTYGRLDARAASETLAELTERLILDIRKGHSSCAVDEVGR
jgi:hypothetical protein